MTIADTIYDVINDNWGNGGYGGTAPTITTSETTKAETRTKTDIVEVRHFTLDERHKQVNDKFADKFYTVVVRVTSKTSAAQLDLLVDEVEYLVRNTTMTGVQFRSLRKSHTPTSREYGVHGCEMFVEVAAYLSSGAVTSASSTGTDLTIGGDLQVNGNDIKDSSSATVISFDGAGAIDLLELGVSVTECLDEDNMASDSATKLATQQSIKAYIDGKTDELSDIGDTTLTGPYLEDLLMFGSANAAYVPCIPFFYNWPDSWDAAGGPSIFRNVDGNDTSFGMILPIPTVKGSLKLYVTRVRVEIADADAGDYLDRVKLYIVRDDDTTLVINDGTSRTAPGTYEYSEYNQDCSAHSQVMLYLDTVCTNAMDLEIQSVAVKCYYGT